MQRPLIALVMGVALAAAAAGAGTLWYERPTRLTVAVSRMDEVDRALVEAAARLLKRSRNAARLQVEAVDDPAAASAAVDAGRADLAVIRTDVAIPGDAQTVVILHRDAAVLAAPASSGIRGLADLPGRAVGVVRLGAGNRRLLETLLEEADLRPDSVAMVELHPEEVEAALRARRVAAVLAVDVLSAGGLRDIVRAAAAVDPPTARPKLAKGAGKAGGKPRRRAVKDDDEEEDAPDDPPPTVVFVPVREAEAIAQRSPAYEKTEVVRGMFGGQPPRPVAAFDTLSITHRLVANENVSQDLISDLTRFFLQEKGAIAATAPIAQRIEAPSTDKGAPLPVHAGSAAYIDDDEQTFFDKYSDMIYIGAMLLGVLASGVTALMGRFGPAPSASLEPSIHRLVEMMGLARASTTGAELDALQAEADALMAKTLDAPSAGPTDARRFAAFGLALDQLRAAVRDRRAALPHAPARPAELLAAE